MNRNVGIYLITCKTSNKRYVGSSNNIKRRWQKHVAELKRCNHDNRYLQNTWNKYGEESFEFAVLEVVEDELQLAIREQHWIDTLHPELNIAISTECFSRGLERTDEWREGMSEGNKRYWENLTEEEKAERNKKQSHPHTEETKRILAENTRKAFEDGRLSRVRRPRTEEEKAKILEGMAGHLAEVRIAKAQRRAIFEAGMPEREAIRRAKLSIAHTGKVVSEETKDKLREANAIQFSDPEAKERHQQAVKEAMQRPEVKEALAARPPQIRTAEANAKSAAKHRGRKNTPETIEAMAQKRREWWANKKAQAVQAQMSLGIDTGDTGT